MKIMKPLITVVYLLITSLVVVSVVFFVTGRTGPVPCGEDSYRWGMQGILLGLPMIMISFFSGLIAVFVFRKKALAKYIVSLVIQLLSSFVFLAILFWPHIIDTPPVCM
jgi:hypothetical protein